MWAITPEERGKYDKQFDSLAPILGYVSGTLLPQQTSGIKKTNLGVASDIQHQHQWFLLIFRRTSPEVLPPVRPASLCPG